MAIHDVFTGNIVLFTNDVSSKPIGAFATNFLALVDVAHNFVTKNSVSNNLTFFNTTTFTLIHHNVSTFNQLFLSQTVSANIKLAKAANVLLFSQTVGVFKPQLTQFTNSSLTFSQSAVAKLKLASANNVLIFSQTVSLNNTIKAQSVSSQLNLQQTLLRTIPVSVFQIFFPYHLARTIKYQIVQSNLVLSQNLSAGFNKPVNSLFAISQDAEAIIIKNITVSQMFVMQSSSRAYTLNCNQFNIVIPPLNDQFIPIPSVC